MLSAGSCDVGRAWKIPPFSCRSDAKASNSTNSRMRHPLSMKSDSTRIWVGNPQPIYQFSACTYEHYIKQKTSKIWFKWQLCYNRAQNKLYELGSSSFHSTCWTSHQSKIRLFLFGITLSTLNHLKTYLRYPLQKTQPQKSTSDYSFWPLVTLCGMQSS